MGHTYKRVPVGRRVCVTRGVEDGAEGGWYLVGGREIRAGSRGSSNSLRARAIESRGSKCETKRRRTGVNVWDKVNAYGVVSPVRNPLFVVLFKKLASSPRRNVPANAALSCSSGLAVGNKREDSLLGINMQLMIICVLIINYLYDVSKMSFTFLKSRKLNQKE